jgi:hypothetical protein
MVWTGNTLPLPLSAGPFLPFCADISLPYVLPSHREFKQVLSFAEVVLDFVRVPQFHSSTIPQFHSPAILSGPLPHS